MMRFRWNKPCAADSCWLTSPGNAAERGMVPEGIHAKAAEATFPVRFPVPDNAHPNAGVRTVPTRDCLSLPGLAIGLSPPGPVAALHGPVETCGWVRLPVAPAGHGHRHGPRSRIRRGRGRGGGSGQAGRRPQPRCCAWGPGAGVGEIEVVCSFDDWPVRVEREDRGGGGLARTAAPDHGNFCSNTPHGNRTGCRSADSSIAR